MFYRREELDKVPKLEARWQDGGISRDVLADRGRIHRAGEEALFACATGEFRWQTDGVLHFSHRVS